MSRAPFAGCVIIGAAGPGGRAQWLGSGWAISERLVVTAGHVVFDAVRSSRRFTRFSGLLLRPAGTRDVARIPATAIRMPQGWSNVSDRVGQRDFATIRVLKPMRWWFPTAATEELPNPLPDCRIAGYPAGGRVVPNGTLVVSQGPVKLMSTPSHPTALRIAHRIDAMPGHSGAPIYLERDNLPVAIGIHLGGFGDHDFEHGGRPLEKTNIGLPLASQFLDFATTIQRVA